jgi:hypothetical protein
MDVEWTSALLMMMLPPASACGGAAGYMAGHLVDHYRKNRHLRKMTIEIVGALLTAPWLAATMPLPCVDCLRNRIFLAFCFGVAWSGVIQHIRMRATSVVDRALSGDVNERDGGKGDKDGTSEEWRD